MNLFAGIQTPGHPDPNNILHLDRLITPQIVRMQRMGVAIDIPGLHELSHTFGNRLVGLQKDICSYIPPEAIDQFIPKEEDEDELPDDWANERRELEEKKAPSLLDSVNLNSPIQVAKLLFDVLKIGAGSKLKTTKSGKLSTGKKQLEFLKLLRPVHPVVPLMMQYRQIHKLKSTYTDTLPKLARIHNKGTCLICGRQHREDHPRVHCTIMSTRTDTGRLAMKKANLQQIPARTEEGRMVRACFIPQPGFKFVDRDYSQFELRWLAHLCMDDNMLRIFWEGLDIHLDTAMRAFNISDPKKVDKNTQRAPCKNVNFGIAYGLAADSLFDQMLSVYALDNRDVPDWLTVEWCEQFIEKWFTLYPAAKEYFDAQHYRAKRYEFVWSYFGRVRLIPEVRSFHPDVISAGLRQAGNMPIQGSQADAMKLGMARVESAFESAREHGIDVEALLPVHDELLCECEEEHAEQVDKVMEVCMEKCLVDGDSKEHLWTLDSDWDKVSGTSGVDTCFNVPIRTEGKIMDRWEK